MGVDPRMGRQSTIHGQTAIAPTLHGDGDGDTVYITVAVDDAFRARSVVQWHGFSPLNPHGGWQRPKTGASSPASGIETVTTFTYSFLADDRPGKFRHSAHTTTDGGARRRSRGQGLMSACQVIQLDYEGPVERILRWSAATLEAATLWVAGLCEGRKNHGVHACPEAQLMAANWSVQPRVIYINDEGPMGWLLR